MKSPVELVVRVAGAALVLGALACHSDVTPPRSDGVSGAYVLQRVGTTSLPFLLASTPGLAGYLTADTMYFDVANATYTERVHFAWVKQQDTIRDSSTNTGSFEVAGSVLVRHLAGTTFSDSATVGAGTLTFVWDCSSCTVRTPFVFQRTP